MRLLPKNWNGQRTAQRLAGDQEAQTGGQLHAMLRTPCEWWSHHLRLSDCAKQAGLLVHDK
jgi:hypothetical protein